MQIKTTLGFHLSSRRMAAIMETRNAGKNAEKRETLYMASGI